MPNDEPLQTDEVVALVTSDKECAIVHVESYQEVNIHEDIYNKKEPWRIATTLLEIPDKPVLHRALALGFQLSSTETRTRRSNPITLYKLHRTCFGMRAAAIKALCLARLLPGVGADAWLWITVREYDERPDTPPRPPAAWPPTNK